MERSVLNTNIWQKVTPRENPDKISYLGIGQKLGRPLIHAHHIYIYYIIYHISYIIYIYELVFFWMLKSQRNKNL